ncbi:hypothetical protein E2C01_000628 [Portunus trituberculatus]|uniref:Uncharacterized protein n=1 Tax=Portunus trituberculatus TaxID=210409 RepID=A0A5B7CF69_PORTR|nr:hypothetical protein [Portunus trituberculatus]
MRDEGKLVPLVWFPSLAPPHVTRMAKLQSRSRNGQVRLGWGIKRWWSLPLDSDAHTPAESSYLLHHGCPVQLVVLTCSMRPCLCAKAE